MTTEERLSSLEKQLGRQRKVSAVCVLALAVICLGAMQDSKKEKIPEVLKAKQIECEGIKVSGLALVGEMGKQNIILTPWMMSITSPGNTPSRSHTLSLEADEIELSVSTLDDTAKVLGKDGKIDAKKLLSEVERLSFVKLGTLRGGVSGFLDILSNNKKAIHLGGTSKNATGGYVEVLNKTGEGIVQLYADEYGNGVVGAWNRKGKGRTLRSGPR